MMWFKKKVAMPEKAKTVVYLRSTRTPAQIWEATVRYDPWGQPYVETNGNLASFGINCLRENGTTDRTWVYGTQWKHKSGPPVRFVPPPKSLWDDVSADSAQ